MASDLFIKSANPSPPSLLTSSKDTHTYENRKSFYSLTTPSIITPRMPLKKKKKDKTSKSKKRQLEGAAPLYTEDLGTEGIKRSSLDNSDGHQTSISCLPLAQDEDERRQKRKQRFGVAQSNESESISAAPSAPRANDEIRSKKIKSSSNESNFVGTSTALEKPYLRLTDFPKPENVRPLPVLMKALAHIKSKYIKNEDFDWANEQLKSVRQDLTVQRIRNKFVLDVYETHARLLLEQGDLNEFNQCQSMIHSLTSLTTKLEPPMDGADGFDGGFEHRARSGNDDKTCLKQSEETADEFYAYGLLYNLVQNSWGEMTRLLSSHQDIASEDTPSVTSSVTSSDYGEIPACFRGASVRHALKVIKAVMHDDYQSFFRLYECTPHMSAYLMDFLVRRVRKNAYQRIIAAYRPCVSVEHFREALSFHDLEEARRFLKKNAAIFIHELGAPPFWVDCKATLAATPRLAGGPQK